MPNQPIMKRPPTPTQGPKKAPQDPELQNEGEGSRSAARRYDDGVEQTMSDPKRVEELARKAQEALEGAEGASLRAAEARGKKASHR